ncbi:MAG: methyltransferase domain-containing protein [Dehalococcoidales bacterium]|nr:methyltransferase domain-containing protein [Dehalococcoidales bacterium]
MPGLNYTTVADPIMRSVRRFTPVFACMRTGDRVLDVCCGTGAQVYEYAVLGLQAVGIDISPHMLGLSRYYSEKFEGSNLSFQTADAASLPFDDAGFDFASISLALHEKETVLQSQIIFEMKRVVKPGGSLIFIDFTCPLPDNIFSFAIKSVEFLAGSEHHRNFREYMKRGGLEEILMQTGLKKIKQAYLKAGNIMLVQTAVD